MTGSLEVQPLHAMKDKRETWCGVVVNTAGDEGLGFAPEAGSKPMLIAPTPGEATCPECKMRAEAGMPNVRARSQAVVGDRLREVAERFAKRPGAPPPPPPPGINAAEITQRVLKKRKG